MAVAARLALSGGLLALLTLGGCACFDEPRAEGFLAPHWRPHHVRPAQPAVAISSETKTALSKCNEALYLKSASSQDDMHALEDKCRALIVNQAP